MERYFAGLRRYLDKAAPDEPSAWTFGELQRDKEGKFSDKDLVKLLQDGCENVAGTFP